MCILAHPNVRAVLLPGNMRLILLLFIFIFFQVKPYVQNRVDQPHNQQKVTLRKTVFKTEVQVGASTEIAELCNTGGMLEVDDLHTRRFNLRASLTRCC